MEFSAAATAPSPDAGQAVPDLCSGLRARAAAESAAVDWATLRVTGPVEVVDRDGAVRYEWTATVRAAVPDRSAVPPVG